MAWSEDTSGVKLKSPPQSFNIDLNAFTIAVGWAKEFILRKYGLEVRSVVHDAYPNLWRFYDSDGEIIISLEHNIMARLALVLEHIEWLTPPDDVAHEELEEWEELFRSMIEEDDGA